MRTCIVCGKKFRPPLDNFYKDTCSRECLREFCKQNVSEAFLKNSFKKGNVPFNKGVPQKEWLSRENQVKCSETHIHKQKGAMSPFAEEEHRFLPHNTNAKGTVVKRQHRHNKGKNAGKNEYEYFINIDWRGNRKPNNLYRKYLWEVANQQDLPKGYVVHLKDGNPDNLDISNMELITRRELLRLNTGK